MRQPGTGVFESSGRRPHAGWACRLVVLLALLLPAARLPLLAQTPATGTLPWRSLGPSGPAVVNSFAFDPEQPEIAYAGLQGGGIARSVDGGLTWRTINQGLNHAYIDHLTVHPRSSQLVYATNGVSQLVRSTDGGMSWSELPVPANLSMDPIAAYAAAPSDPSVVYAGTDAGIFVSENRGDNWRRVRGAGLPRWYGVDRQGLAVDAQDARLIYAGIVNEASGFGLWVSRDAGDTWVRLRRTGGIQLIGDPLRPRTMYLLKYGEILRSRDAGLSWGTYFTGGYALSLAFDPHHPWVAYLQNMGDLSPETRHERLYRTADDGGHWQAIPTDLPIPGPGGHESSDLAASSVGALLVTVDNHTYRSTDGGVHWTAGGRGLVNTYVSAVAFGAPGTLFAATGFIDFNHPGVFRSRDGGATWSYVLQLDWVTALAVDRQHPDTVYASAYPIPGTNPTSVWKTTDGGRSWQPLPYFGSPFDPFTPWDVAIDPTDPQIVYVAAQTTGTAPIGGVFRSLDGGQSWTQTNLPSLLYSSLAVAPGQPGTVWTIAQGDAYKSTDYGTTWNRMLSADDSFAWAVAVAPSDPDAVWVLGNGAVHHSTDGGFTWRRWPGFLVPSFWRLYSHPLAVDPTDPEILYVGSGPVGVFRRSPGTGWQSLNAGLPNRDVLSIAIDPADPARLIVGTFGAGAYQLAAAPAARPTAALLRTPPAGH